MGHRLVYKRLGGGQAARDDNGKWHVRFYKFNKFSSWQLHKGKGKPPGTAVTGKLLDDTDIEWSTQHGKQECKT